MDCLRTKEDEGTEEEEEGEEEEEADEEEEEEEDEEEEWTVSKGNYLLRAMAKMMRPYPESNDDDSDADMEENSTRSGRSTPSNSISSIAQREVSSPNEQPTPHFELIQPSHAFLTPTHFNPDLDILFISSSPITPPPPPTLPPSQSSSTPFLPHNTILDSLARWLSPSLIPQIRYLAMSQSTFRTLALQVEEVWEGMGWGDLGDMEERMGVMLGRDFEDLERLFVVADPVVSSGAEIEGKGKFGGNCKDKGKGKGEMEESREVDADEVMKRAIEDVARLMARVRGKVPGFRVRSWTLALEETSILRLVNGEGSSFGFRTVRR